MSAIGDGGLNGRGKNITAIGHNSFICGGESGIRTHDTVARIPVFETGAFVRSAISPDGLSISESIVIFKYDPVGWRRDWSRWPQRRFFGNRYAEAPALAGQNWAGSSTICGSSVPVDAVEGLSQRLSAVIVL